MNLIKKIGLIFVVIITFILTFLLRSVPHGTNWNGYIILYVDSSAASSVVENTMLKNGIKDYVSLDGQRAPIMLARNSIEEAMLKLTIRDDSNKYLVERQNYFYDSTGSYLLYYVPTKYERELAPVITELSKSGYKTGIDTSISYMWLLPVVVILATIILLVFAKNKFMFFTASILPCVYAACNAFHSAAIAVIILELCIFLYTNIYNRKGAVKKFVRQYIILGAVVIAVITAFSTGLLSGFIFVMVLAGVLSLMILCDKIIIKHNAHFHFQPVLIRTAKQVSVYGGKVKKVFPVAVAACVIIIAYFALGSSRAGLASKSDKKLLLPGSTSQTDSRLPGFEDYSRWIWNVKTYPYKSLNVPDEQTDSVVYPRYLDEGDTIVRTDVVMNYDQSFKKKVYDEIDLLDFNSIEKIIKQQGSGFNAGYTDSASYNISIFSIIMMIIGFCMLLFIYFSAMIGKGGRR